MHHSIIRLVPSLLLLLACTLMTATAVAAEREWVVIAATGTVAITAGDAGQTALDARAGARLATPFSIRTGSDGQLVIARGQDVLTIGPGTRLEVPEPVQTGQGIVTRIHQALGSILYQVEHRLKDAFEAHTPYLVSVVKGTTFNILVSADTSTVALIEGLLHVYTPDDKYEAFLEAGQVAVKTADGDGIRIEDQRSLSEPVAGVVRIGREDELLASAANEPVLSIDRLSSSLPDASLGDSETRVVSSLSADLGGAGILGAAIDDSSVRLGGVTLGGDGLLDVGLEESSVTLGSVSIGGTALTPGLEVGELSADLGGVALNIGDDLSVGLDIGETSIALDGASIGGTALTPGLEVGEISVNLGGVDLDLGSDLGLDLDLGDTSIELGGAMLGQTALTPEIGLGETALSLGEEGLGLSTGIETGILGTVELGLEIDTTPVIDVVDTVVDIANDTTSTLAPIVGGITGGLGRLF